jgi:hypothetical protein
MKLPSYPWRFAHLAALWGYGVSQPIFSMLKGNPEFLVVRGSTRGDVIAFALILAFAPPLVAVGVAAAVSIVSRTLGRTLHIVAIWCFALLAALQLVRLLAPDEVVTLLLPMLPATLAALAYLHWNGFRTFLSISIALPMLGLLVFVVTVPLAIDDAEGADIRIATPTPVVVVVFDEFPVSSLLGPNGAIDAVRYPNFARLARAATWYPHATTVHEHTTQAVPAILTGISPHRGELPTLADHPRNLFTLLGERYRLHVTEVVTRLCPVRYCPQAEVRPPALDRERGLFYDVGVGYLHRVLPKSMRGDLPPIGDRWGGFGDNGDRTSQLLLGATDPGDVDLAVQRNGTDPRSSFLSFVRSIRAEAPARSLYFEHVELPHTPWRGLPSGRQYGNSDTIDGIYEDSWNQWTTDSWQVDQALQRHLLQVGYTDKLLGDLLSRLKATGLYDRALVVVVADHGESFQPGGSRRLVTRDNLAEIAGVPLFVKYPDQHRGRRDPRVAKTIDIVPTIADVLGVHIPWTVDGISLRAESRDRTVTVSRRAGGVVSGNIEDVEARVLAIARRNAALFGEGGDSMYRIGPHAELLGRSVQGMQRRAVTGARVVLDGAGLFAEVHSSVGFVPARVVGELVGKTPPVGAALAVVVNDRVAATTQVFSVDGRKRFTAMVPEGVFHDGGNDVEIYGVAGQGQHVTLAHLGGTGTSSRYELSADGRTITLPGDRRVLVLPNRLSGALEVWEPRGATVQVAGWAADLHDGALVDRVLAFTGRRLVYAGATTVYRWDLPATQHQRALVRSGWVAEMPTRDVHRSSLRVFAVRGNVATELAWPT